MYHTDNALAILLLFEINVMYMNKNKLGIITCVCKEI